MNRKLAAIVAADVVGYSRRTGIDEAGTIQAVRALRDEILLPVLSDHGGRMVKTMGDGFLMEFASVVDGVEAAVVIQTRLAEDLDPDPLSMRIGVHVGDVVTDSGDLLGDGVNLAARLETLSEPGGIAVSDDAHRQVRDRLTLVWKDGGTRQVKNIARPVHVWHWQNSGDRRPPPVVTTEADLKTPDRPSVAVLPFDNMSGDPEQEFFADGMTEDLITDLSKISGLFVVARNSTAALKGQPVDIPSVARRLGVRHMIEGSVRKAGNRVRINVQLIEAENRGHVWADRFDGLLDDVFELQDNVCAQVVSALSVRLTRTEEARLTHVHTHNLAAYELFVQAKATPYPPIPDRIRTAREMFERVIEMAPDFAGGYAGLASVTAFGALWGHGGSAEPARRAETLARKAIEVDESFGWSHVGLALALACQRRLAEAVVAAQRCLDLLPNDPDAHAYNALIRTYDGDFDTGLAHIEQAIRLNPQFINGPYLNMRCQLQFLRGDHAAAMASYAENVCRGGPVGPPAICWAVTACSALGHKDEASRLVAELRQRFPAFRLTGWNFLDLLDSQTLRDRVRDQMLDAGLPA